MNLKYAIIVSTLIAVSIVMLTTVCGGNGEAPGDQRTTIDASVAPTSDSSAASTPDDSAPTDSPAATPAADSPDTSSLPLDEYITMVCGEALTEVESWEGGDSLADLSAGLGFISDQMSALDPPMEVAEWHHAQIAYAGVFKETIDDFLKEPGNRTEDEFILSMFFTVGPHFGPVEQAIATMDTDVRARMTEAGCIDPELSGAVPIEQERTEVAVGGVVEGDLAAPDQPALLEFQAEMGQKYFIEVTWEGVPDLYLLIKDPPDPVVDSVIQLGLDSSPFTRRWTAPASGPFHIDLGAYEGAGSYAISISRDTSPDAPTGVTAIWEDATVRVSWEPAAGAEYYKVYHDDLGPGCQLDDGIARFCDELSAQVAGTNYVHSSPDPDDNFYFIIACSRGGCSAIDSYNPASP